MKKHGIFKKFISCFIVIMMMASIVPLSITSFAADPVSFTVTNVSGAVGSDVVVTISISANTNMGCVALNLQYDTTKLTYKSYTLGSAATSSGPGNYMAQINPTYAVNGNLTTINDSYISDPGIMAGGAMINYKFTIKSGWTGSTPLTLTVRDLYTVDWNPLSSTVENGSVAISGPIMFTAGNVSGAVGTDVDVAINVSAYSTLASVALNLQYDTTKLTYKSYTIGSAAMSSGPGNYMAQINPTYAVNGNLTTINDSYISDPGIIAGGEMITYKFTIKSGWTGSTPLTLTALDVFNVTWNPLASTVASGSVSVLIPQYTVTFDANGGTGGTSGLMDFGAALNAPAVKRPGYGLSGWSPSVPPTVGAGDATYTAQWVETDVNVTKTGESLTVNIKGWTADYKYQIWTYQKVTSDLFLNTANNVTANQWILSQAYTLGSAGAMQPDASINFVIGTFVSPNNNYTIAVRIVDENGNYICEMRDSYTPEALLEAHITKIIVDGEHARGSSQEDIDNNVKGTEFKEIKAGASTTVKVIGNLPGMTYTATVMETMTALTVSNGNEFIWNISSLIPRIYTVRITASNGATTDTHDVKFILYAGTEGTQYGTMNGLNITGGNLPTVPQNIEITPNFSNGNFYYVIREPGRAAIIKSGQYSAATAIQQEIAKFGTYYVYGYVNRASISPSEAAYDDGVIKTIEIKRSQVLPSSATLTAKVNSEPANLANPIAKGTTILFEASATIGGIGATPVQYSFWRYDAKGYSLVKDWSLDNTLSWIPGRVGNYTIQVRAKGEDAGSYEVKTSVSVSITNAGEEIAQGVVITLNETELNLNAKARTPITIKASATNTNGDDLLYCFYAIDDAMLNDTLQNYSANQECIWTPRKAGIYQISVLVKNKVSFGKFDAIKQVMITVD